MFLQEMDSMAKSRQTMAEQLMNDIVDQFKNLFTKKEEARKKVSFELKLINFELLIKLIND